MPQRSLVTWQLEDGLWNLGYTQIAGIGEAGRGALAGPVVAAAVIFPLGVTIAKVDDSKRLSRSEREALFQTILHTAIGVGLGYVDPLVIDRLNIRQSTLLAMQAALHNLGCEPDFLLIDGCDGVPVKQPQRIVVRGD